MNANIKFMQSIEKDGANIEVKDIIITESENGLNRYFNHIRQEGEKIVLVDLETEYKYSTYDDLNELKKHIEKGFVITIGNKFERVLKIISLKNLIEDLKSLI